MRLNNTTGPLVIAAIVLTAALAFATLPRWIPSSSDVQTGKPAPNIRMRLVHNGEALADPPALPPLAVSLSDLKGKAVILDFWATWCGPCRAEMPIVDRIAQRFKDRGLVVIGVNTSDEDGLAMPYAKENKLSYPIAFDEGAAARAFDVDNLPTLVVISRTGKIVAIRQGMTDTTELEALVAQAL